MSKKKSKLPDFSDEDYPGAREFIKLSGTDPSNVFVNSEGSLIVNGGWVRNDNVDIGPDYMAARKPKNASPSTSPKAKSSKHTNHPSLFGSDVHSAPEQGEEEMMEMFRKNPEMAQDFMMNYFHAADRHKDKQQTDYITITPDAGFVVLIQLAKEAKVGHLLETNKSTFPKGTKVFVNMCSSDKITKPTDVPEYEIQKTLNGQPSVYEVPVHIGEPRKYTSKDEPGYLVIDGCVHADVLTRAKKDHPYGMYIIEVVFHWIEEKCRLVLDRDTIGMLPIRSKDKIPSRPIKLIPQPKAPILEVPAEEKTSKAPKLAKSQEPLNKSDVPVAGKDDIILDHRTLSCPNGTGGSIIEIPFPNHVNSSDITVDIVLRNKLVVHAKSQGKKVDGGKDYHLEVDLPNRPVGLETLDAEFNKQTRTLRVYTLGSKA
ncbi:pre-RNA processing PIH1/Nop17-domain-containing protein [Lobosporangium transversale]|uniref:Pre-RNA processing PIH1/Nop17-domain-containing protein n=1 Tax=Lobosporangium transversale TaxID=64571 RepID=A0A1Y2GRH8_9FUNG|nr:pre-RNA processing PIH1/Nop17-domain-containing protein [Lobosporangium transversale]ORZ20134.1 pre-RNA processing PIH1/Nop17-domain-containing protein [Lobosporangium transversale]|eukprot:XP_021882674.1 pre-RNA processing PIH1/Nop17-domain-containing protein [Lobosporangium transversale]